MLEALSFISLSRSTGLGLTSRLSEHCNSNIPDKVRFLVSLSESSFLDESGLYELDGALGSGGRGGGSLSPIRERKLPRP